MKSLLNVSLLALAGTLTLSACQSTPSTLPVIQRPNNVFETTGLGKTKTIARSKAISIATQQCRGKSPIVLTDTYQYNGVLDEGMGRVADQAMGVIGGLLGSKQTISRDDDYEYTLTFRCTA